MELDPEASVKLSEQTLEQHLYSQKPLMLSLATKDEIGTVEYIKTRVVAGIRDGLWLCQTGKDYFLIKEQRDGWIPYIPDVLK